LTSRVDVFPKARRDFTEEARRRDFALRLSAWISFQRLGSGSLQRLGGGTSLEMHFRRQGLNPDRKIPALTE